MADHRATVAEAELAERPAERFMRAVDPAIAAHRLLGNGRSTALIRPQGEIDWWCAPEVDSPPLLWSLLDPEGSASRWVDVRLIRRSQDPAGQAMRTVVRAPGGGRVELWDGLISIEGPHPHGDGASADAGGVALVRAVRSLSQGSTTLTHELGLGGFDRPWNTWDGATPALDGVSIRPFGTTQPVEISGDQRWLRLPVQAEEGRWSGLVIGVGTPADHDVEALLQELADAEQATASALGSARLPRHHPERARDALAVLRACTFRASGAVVASPTTSLPEAPGADRQFDYRFSWLRDASLAVSVAALLGMSDDAESYLRFLHQLVERDEPPGPVTDVRGAPVPEERVVEGVRGWAGSRPIRLGNAAAGQVQFDALGMVVEAVSVYLQTGGRLDDRTWSLVRQIADHVVEHNGEPSAGIWEFREDALLVSADLGSWLALDRAIWITRLRRPFARRRRWKQARKIIHRRLSAAITEQGGLPQCYDEQEPRADASTLMAAVFGTFRGRRAKARRLVDATVSDLDSEPFLYRYEPGGDDGFHGIEGAFLPMSWWAVIALANAGRVAEATERADAMCAALPRLLAEEVDPATGAMLGNVPLVWSHMGAARAMYVLDAARLRDRYGPVGLAIWRVSRYVSLVLRR